MRESTRQKLLRAIDWRAAWKEDFHGCNPVYIPRDVCAVAGREWDGKPSHNPYAASFSEAAALGATNFRPDADRRQIVADWPQFPFAVAAYLDREFAAAGFNFRPPAWFAAARAAGNAGRLVTPTIPSRSEYHPTSVLINSGLADWT